MHCTSEQKTRFYLNILKTKASLDKLLSKLEESEPEPPTSQEDECVICINARATMQTSPCGHRVVCRRCFVKTIQSAVAQRLLPLRCVICRARVNRLTSSSGTWRIQESASSYSMGSKSWASAGVGIGVPPSASSYSMGDAHSGHHFHAHHHNGTTAAAPGHHRVAQSTSLYSMSSGASSQSSASNLTNFSKTSSASSGLLVDASSCSPSSPVSPSSLSYTQSILNNHLAPPTRSSTSAASSVHHHHNHSHSPHLSCPTGCSGAIPRKPLNANGSMGCIGSSPIAGCTTPSTNTYPGRRHTKGRIADLQNRLPPIKEFRSPAKAPHPSPVHISNPRFRYSSYTKSTTNSNSHEMVPLLREPPSPPRRPLNVLVTSSLTTMTPLKQSLGSGLSAKISPITSKSSMPKNGFMVPASPSSKNSHNNTNGKVTSLISGSKNQHTNNSNNNKKLDINLNLNQIQNSSNHSSKNGPLFSSNNYKEKAENKKNETVERKKKEEKQKLKAEKEARKEEKRIAKEEERIAKNLAKEEKKKGRKEAKELLLANDGNRK